MNNPALNFITFACAALTAGATLWGLTGAAAAGSFEVTAYETVTLARTGPTCAEDRHCFNRLHPEIPMAARATPGQMIVFETRDAGDTNYGFDSQLPRDADPAQIGMVHPLTGPVYIEGAVRGDALAITIIDIAPGGYGFTVAAPGRGFAGDTITGAPLLANWRLTRQYAVSEQIPGVRIPYGAFPGIITVLPGAREVLAIRTREQELAEHGGVVRPPMPAGAVPSAICGPEGKFRDQCLRTIPPREHGGNMDIRYMQAGSTIVLPCYLEGCGLAIGDVHYAQGDGEVAGTAIEMAATVTVRVEVLKGQGTGMTTPHYSNPNGVRSATSGAFFATTGLPLKAKEAVPPHLAYLQSAHVTELENLSQDLSLAARNALLAMIRHLTETRGYTRQQAFIIASVAVDLRIGQLVDGANHGVTAILPLNIFTD